MPSTSFSAGARRGNSVGYGRRRLASWAGYWVRCSARGGPPYVAYLTGRLRDPGAQRATISQMVILSVGLRVIIFAVAGLLFTRNLWTAVGLLLPVAWIGVWVGHRIQLRVAPAMLARVIALALFVTGASLIVRTL